MQINRLFEILYILLNKKTISAKYLADKLEVSTRTIYRDIDILSSVGIPIYTSRGKSGGIHLLENAILDKCILTKDEKIDLLIALESLNGFNINSKQNIFSKLESLFGKNQKNYMEIDYSPYENNIKLQFESSKEAILTNKILLFDYISTKGEKTSRKVEPYILWFKGKAWYLKSYCLDKNEFRIFRLSRMKNMQISSIDYIERELDFQLSKENTDLLSSVVKIKLKIDISQKYRVMDDFSEKNITYDLDKNLIVNLEFPENEWLYGYILSYGSFATVIEPQYIRDNIKNRLLENVNKYL